MKFKVVNPAHQIIRIIALALLAHYALCWPLWYSGAGRTFPVLPVFSFIGAFPIWVEGLQAGFLVMLTMAVFVFPKKKTVVQALLAFLIFMVVQDISRLQVWLYFYLLAFVIILVAEQSPAMSTTGFRFLLAAVYAWGGFNKMTPYFAVDNFPWFCEAFAWTRPLGQIPALGYGFALAEFLFALGLLWPRSRPVFRWIVVVFHLFICLALSPAGLDWNAAVIPWNLAMAAMVWLLFKPGMLGGTEFLKRQKSPVRIAFYTPLLLAWAMPVLNIFHCWDEALSWKMYTNTQTEANFYSDNGQVCSNLQAVWQQHAFNNGKTILLDDWAFANLHVPAYNSRRTHLQIARYLCPCTNNSAASGLLLLQVERWNRPAEHWEQIPCSSIHR